eukprot:jgi/Orpsp1_1/1187898/evm.model.d7180000061014.1
MVATNSRSGRNFILTLNASVLEFYADIKEYLLSLSQFQYFLCCEHIGDPVMNNHYHIYVQYNNTKKLTLSRLYSAHIDVCYGSAQANIAYVRAEDEKHRAAGITAELSLKKALRGLREVTILNKEDFERREQWERRINLVDLYPPERVHIGGLPVGYRTSFNDFEHYTIENTDGSSTIVNLD